MNWYKRQLKISQRSFTPEELVNIGYRLMDWGDYDENLGTARSPVGVDAPEIGLFNKEEEKFAPVDENFVDTRFIVQLGRLLVGNEGDISVYAPMEDETRGAIEELQNIISINSTFAQPLEDVEIRNIKILISQVYKLGQILGYWI